MTEKELLKSYTGEHITVFLMNGVRLTGTIIEVFENSIHASSDDDKPDLLIFNHGISSISLTKEKNFNN